LIICFYSSKMEDVDRVKLLQYKITGWRLSLEFKLNALQRSLNSLETAIQALNTTSAQTPSILVPLQQVYEYLESQHHQSIEEISDVTLIEENIDSMTPFVDTAHYYVNILMIHHAALCSNVSSYNDRIGTIDDIISYIYDLGLLTTGS
jgi:hypothetical protein